MLDGVRINSLQFMGARAFGPALAGLVLEVFGPSGAFLINAISFLIVLVALLAVRPRPVPRAQGQWRVLDHFREGLRYLLARESLWLAVVVMFFISFFPSAVLQLAPAIAKEFDVGQGAYGLIVALFGGGAIVGSVFVAMFADRFRRSALVIAGSISIGAAVVALGLALSVLSGGALDLRTGVVIGAAVVITYTVAGGMWSVALTDFVQAIEASGFVRDRWWRVG